MLKFGVQETYVPYISKEHIQTAFLLHGPLTNTRDRDFICSIGLNDCGLVGLSTIANDVRVSRTFTSAYLLSIVDFNSGKFVPSKSNR